MSVSELRWRRPATTISALLFLLVLPLLALAACADRPSEEEIASATERLRQLYFDRDYAAAAVEGRDWAERAPGAFELRAWWLQSLARDAEAEEAVTEAEAMVEERGGDPWAWFALAGALNWDEERGEEALPASERALFLRPDDVHFAWLQADVIRKQEGEEQAVAFVDSLPASLAEHPLLLVRRGVALYYASNAAEGEEQERLRREAYAAFAGAREKAPEDVEAHFLPGAYLTNAQDLEEAFPLLDRAAELTPAPEVHRFLWRVVQGRRDLSQEEKAALIEADVARMLEASGRSGPALQAASSVYGDLGLDEKREEMEEEVLARHPVSESAEWVLVNRYRALAEKIYEARREGEEPDPELEARYRQMLVDFIDRPEHVRETLLGDAYRNLFHLVRHDPEVGADRIHEIVRGIVDYEGINLHIIHAEAPMALAERKIRFREAEEIAQAGFEAAEEEVAEARERERYDTDGEYERLRDRWFGTFHDAIGWIYFHEGRLDEAEKELLAAHDLNPENAGNLYRLGRLYEARHDLATGASLETAIATRFPEDDEQGESSQAAGSEGGPEGQAYARGESEDGRDGTGGEETAGPSAGTAGEAAGADAASGVDVAASLADGVPGEAGEWMAQAEEFYIKGAMVQTMGTNPAEEALEALYAKRHGTLEGYDAYLAAAEEIDRERRYEEILADRIEQPEPMPAFTLETLDPYAPSLARASTLESEALRGKIVVINFWGTWCGPCVAEMPDFQKFHEKYRNDPGVVVLTINNDTNPDQVREWMAEKEYDFPILLDEGYVSEADVTAFPTTWFVDPEGRIVFSKRGWSEALVEEFGWRVEALRPSS